MSKGKWLDLTGCWEHSGMCLLMTKIFPGIGDSKLLVYWSLDFSVQFSCSVVSNSLRPHKLQQVRPPCPSPTPGVHPNPCPLSRWCHPTISSSVVPFSSCPQSFPASGSFPMSQLFISGGQSIVVSVSASVLPMNIQEIPIPKKGNAFLTGSW